VDRALVYPVHRGRTSVRLGAPGFGAGPGTALKIGFLAGFLAGFPDNFAQATWFAGGRALPFGWMVEMWLGAILAALVAGFLYKE
jgi:hypothetical protein